ncbi:hypothetical protein AFR_07600 [Actinoplanes friuliensis DSM 7358]|uniref:Uncharacterized protein n=1 Tax=Actinoplanes friuliensis DSM 7358 TaxID=1246995 RepID=U5VSG7_9ACTN|nr:hypothetical protein AFR_07600 [Actinoplanes friuliensis DSM 7358]
MNFGRGVVVRRAGAGSSGGPGRGGLGSDSFARGGLLFADLPRGRFQVAQQVVVGGSGSGSLRFGVEEAARAVTGAFGCGPGGRGAGRVGVDRRCHHVIGHGGSGLRLELRGWFRVAVQGQVDLRIVGR